MSNNKPTKEQFKKNYTKVIKRKSNSLLIPGIFTARKTTRRKQFLNILKNIKKKKI